MTIRGLLRLLLGSMLLVLIAALAIPAWSAINELRDATRVVANARAGQSVFAALQYLRPERGIVPERRAADAARRLWFQAGLLTSGLVVGCVGFMVVQRRIIVPIHAMSGTMRRLALGDLATDIAGEGRRDEIGEMIDAVIVFRDGMVQSMRLETEQAEMRERGTVEKFAALRQMATTIETESERVMDAVGVRTATMVGAAEEMSASAERTGESAHGAASAAAEVQANAQTIASAAEQLAASIREIGAQVGLSTTMAGHAVIAGNETRATMDALNEQVGKIGVVADMIREIAAKTNLLALNATIEAARAGDAGRGFAVVANEVKQLATQTARSTEEIARHIGEMRAATGISVAAVGWIEQTIAEMNAIASSIVEAVEEQSPATAEIARNVTGTAAAANEMTRRIDEVSTEAERTGRYSGQVRDGAVALNGVVDELKHAVIKMVRTSTAEVNRRERVRHAVDLPCRLPIDGAVHSARAADLSSGGAAVVGAPVLTIGSRGTLEVDGVEIKLPFTVRAAGAKMVNLMFALDATDTARLEQILGQLAARRAA